MDDYYLKVESLTVVSYDKGEADTKDPREANWKCQRWREPKKKGS